MVTDCRSIDKWVQAALRVDRCTISWWNAHSFWIEIFVSFTDSSERAWWPGTICEINEVGGKREWWGARSSHSLYRGHGRTSAARYLHERVTISKSSHSTGSELLKLLLSTYKTDHHEIFRSYILLAFTTSVRRCYYSSQRIQVLLRHWVSGSSLSARFQSAAALLGFGHCSFLGTSILRCICNASFVEPRLGGYWARGCGLRISWYGMSLKSTMKTNDR